MSQRSAFICEKIFPCPYWCKAYIFILILAFMMGKKLQRIKKIGVKFLGGVLGERGRSVSQGQPKHTTADVPLIVEDVWCF